MSANYQGKFFRLEEPANSQPRIWSLVFDTPGEKVNKLGRDVMSEFEGLLPKLEELGKEGKIDALIFFSAKPGNFIAGADITMIQAVKEASEGEAISRMGHQLADRFEDLSFPTVAAIDGAALGGGCEMALACSALVMSDNPAAKIGLPETMLGVVPGMGGCIRLPRKVGLATAFDLILTGKTLNGERAYKAGLADGFIPRQDFEGSVRGWTQKNLKALQDGTRIAKEPKLGGMGGAMGAMMEKTPMGRALILKKAREGVLSKTKGNYPAPIEVIDIVHDTSGAYSGSSGKVRGAARERAMEREAKGFGKLAATDISKNLIRIFFLTEDVKKSKGLPEGVSATALDVTSGAVLGAGVMGGGIAQLLADKGIANRMKDLNSQALTLGIQAATKIFQKQLKSRKINKRQFMQKLNLIAPVMDYSGFNSTDVVIEAIVENMDIKKKVLAEVETQVGEHTIIASNTSSLSVTEMQKALKRPANFVGMHFFNPVAKMPLVEVIRGAQSSNEAVSTIYQFSKKLGKTPIVVKDAPGFLVNRLLIPYCNEATYVLADGVPIELIDKVLLRFGMPMGPMELIDEVGIDVGDKVSHILHAAFGNRMEPSSVNAKILASGRLGKKNGKGIYHYENGRKTTPDHEIYTLIGVAPDAKKMSEEEILDRCILPMVNEAARCLEEEIVSSPEQVDLGMIMGTGFPPFRGGLLRYADSIGAKELVEKLEKYHARFGARFEPAPALVRRAASGQKFYSR